MMCLYRKQTKSQRSSKCRKITLHAFLTWAAERKRGRREEEIHSFLSYAETKEGVHTERWSSGRRGFDTGGQSGAKTTFLV